MPGGSSGVKPWCVRRASVEDAPDETRTIQVTEPVKEFIETLGVAEDFDERLTPHSDVDNVFMLEI